MANVRESVPFTETSRGSELLLQHSPLQGMGTAFFAQAISNPHLCWDQLQEAFATPKERERAQQGLLWLLLRLHSLPGAASAASAPDAQDLELADAPAELPAGDAPDEATKPERVACALHDGPIFHDGDSPECTLMPPADEIISHEPDIIYRTSALYIARSATTIYKIPAELLHISPAFFEAFQLSNATCGAAVVSRCGDAAIKDVPLQESTRGALFTVLQVHNDRVACVAAISMRSVCIAQIPALDLNLPQTTALDSQQGIIADGRITGPLPSHSSPDTFLGLHIASLSAGVVPTTVSLVARDLERTGVRAILHPRTQTYPLEVAAVATGTGSRIVVVVGSDSLQGDARLAKDTPVPNGCEVGRLNSEMMVRCLPPVQPGALQIGPMMDAFSTAHMVAAVATRPGVLLVLIEETEKILRSCIIPRRSHFILVGYFRHLPRPASKAATRSLFRMFVALWVYHGMRHRISTFIRGLGYSGMVDARGRWQPRVLTADVEQQKIGDASTVQDALEQTPQDTTPALETSPAPSDGVANDQPSTTTQDPDTPEEAAPSTGDNTSRDAPSPEAAASPSADSTAPETGGTGDKDATPAGDAAPSVDGAPEGVDKDAIPVDCSIPALKESRAAKEWQRQKDSEGAEDESIDEIMGMIGLESVKEQILAIKAKVETSKRQGVSLKKDRYNCAFLGNPGTGKTTIARLYAKVLQNLGVLRGDGWEETTGSLLADRDIKGARGHMDSLKSDGGGVFFIDEAYQLMSRHHYWGRAVLDYLLGEMENNVGKIVFIFAGYNKDMEAFFSYNPGLPSRIPFKFQFNDYDDSELLAIFKKRVQDHYSGRAVLEGGVHGLYARIVARRVGRGRGGPGHGNARSMENAFARIRERQSVRVTDARRRGEESDDLQFTKEDLLGPNPSSAILDSSAWKKLKGLTGLESVKESVQNVVDLIQLNHKRELEEKKLAQLSLNKVFLGNPGTGKTTVAKLYGQILVDLGLLSNGEVVVKNPADFVGPYIGQSEENTKKILAASVGKVLVIDEAYMLYGGGGSDDDKSTDSFRTAVIDTIVAEVQNVPGEDRCILLLGYRPQMLAMFQNVNPGLSRRFAIEDAFTFDDFTREQLALILESKLEDQDLAATDAAKKTTLDVLDRMRNRPNFGNAGEVENQLSQAKNRYQSRMATLPLNERPLDIVFEPQDIDPDHDRHLRAAENLKNIFADVVGCEAIVKKLAGYQNVSKNLKARGRDPRGIIPMNFVFKGPPGTGKTTTARKIGHVFCDMGFLSSAEVVECSASDLVGKYIGHTGPKTRKLFEKASGKVLFVDEAYRLAEGQFAREAIDELVGLITSDDFKHKLVIVLAGYDQDINRLMSVNSGLSSRFPEEIKFRNLAPSACMTILVRQLRKMDVRCADLEDPLSFAYREVIRALEKLAQIPSWGNARDVETLAQAMVGTVYQTVEPEDELVLEPWDAIDAVRRMLLDKHERISGMPGQPVALDPSEEPSSPASSSATLTPGSGDTSPLVVSGHDGLMIKADRAYTSGTLAISSTSLLATLVTLATFMSFTTWLTLWAPGQSII